MKESIIKYIFLSLLFFISIFGVNSQSFSEIYNSNLPIAYLFNLPPLPAKKLLMNEFFRDEKTSSFTTICDSYTDINGIFTINLSVKVFERIIMRASISIQSDNLGIFNYITEINVTNPNTEETTNVKYSGTQQSAMEVTVLFLNTIQLFYDTEKLFSFPIQETVDESNIEEQLGQRLDIRDTGSKPQNKLMIIFLICIFFLGIIITFLLLKHRYKIMEMLR